MVLWLKEFRTSLHDRLLSLSWGQWSSLGVPGYGEKLPPAVIDPESLLIFTCSVARYDQRLFDEVLNWLISNERFINIQRLRTISVQEFWDCHSVLGAIASMMCQHNKTPKWRKLVKDLRPETKTMDPLFYLSDGRPIPVSSDFDAIFASYGLKRNVFKPSKAKMGFRPKDARNLWLQLRALFGVNVRCEVMLYLLTHQQARIQDIAKQSYYSWKSVQDALFELGQTGLFSFPKAKRGRAYRINTESWLQLLIEDQGQHLRWICWPKVFSVIVQIWAAINSKSFLEMSDLGRVSQLRVLMRETVAPNLEESGLAWGLDYQDSFQGLDYIEVFQRDVSRILDALLPDP